MFFSCTISNKAYTATQCELRCGETKCSLRVQRRGIRTVTGSEVSQWATVALIRLQSILSLTAFISSPWLPDSSKPIPLFPLTALFRAPYFFHEYGGSTYPRGTGNYWRKYTASRSVRLALSTETILYGRYKCCMGQSM